MTALPLPRNAFPIVQARANGMRPAHSVIVAMTPRYIATAADATVYIDPGKRYRWDWLRGLPDVVVAIDRSVKLGGLLRDLFDANPEQLDVVDIERRKGWMVLFAEPLRTIRWPAAQVAAWLAPTE